MCHEQKMCVNSGTKNTKHDNGVIWYLICKHMFKYSSALTDKYLHTQVQEYIIFDFLIHSDGIISSKYQYYIH